MILGGSGAAGSSGNEYKQKLPYNNNTAASSSPYRFTV